MFNDLKSLMLRVASVCERAIAVAAMSESSDSSVRPRNNASPRNRPAVSAIPSSTLMILPLNLTFMESTHI